MAKTLHFPKSCLLSILPWPVDVCKLKCQTVSKLKKHSNIQLSCQSHPLLSFITTTWHCAHKCHCCAGSRGDACQGIYQKPDDLQSRINLWHFHSYPRSSRKPKIPFHFWKFWNGALNHFRGVRDLSRCSQAFRAPGTPLGRDEENGKVRLSLFLSPYEMDVAQVSMGKLQG